MDSKYNTMMVTLLLLATYSLAFVEECTAWIPPSSPHIRYDSSIQSKSSDRREFLTSFIVGTALALPSLPAAAADTSQVQKDKDNIVKGYNRLQCELSLLLLVHFDVHKLHSLLPLQIFLIIGIARQLFVKLDKRYVDNIIHIGEHI